MRLLRALHSDIVVALILLALAVTVSKMTVAASLRWAHSLVHLALAIRTIRIFQRIAYQAQFFTHF